MADETPTRPAGVSPDRRSSRGCGFGHSSLICRTGVCKDRNRLPQTGHGGRQGDGDDAVREHASQAARASGERSCGTGSCVAGFESALTKFLHVHAAAVDDAFQRADGDRLAAVGGDNDLPSVSVTPLLMAAFLRDEREAVAVEHARDICCRADRVMLAHVSATSSTFAPAGSSISVGSNQRASASRALAMACSPVSPALAQPGISGKTADQRPVVWSCSTTRRTFMSRM